MRQFTAVSNFTDFQGVPVNGDRLAFYVKGGVSLATIYDKNGTSIQNPVKIVNGRTEKQVFIGDVDVTAVQQTLVDEELDTWSNVESWDDLQPVQQVTVAGGFPTVDTMAALKALDTSVGIVNLLGYSTRGDKPIVTYVWDPTDTTPRNDATKVRSDNSESGRWVAKWEDSFIDVRHFGIFPQLNMTEEQHAAIASAETSASAAGKNLYFPSLGNRNYYEIGGCVINNAKFDTAVVVFNLGSTAAGLYNCGDVHAYGIYGNGNINIYGDDLNTSQNVNTAGNVLLKPNRSVIISSNYGLSSVWKGVEVILKAELTKSMEFEDCTFSGTGKMMGRSQTFKFTRCEIRQSIFADESDYDFFQFEDCFSNFSMWSDAQKFLTFSVKNESKEADFNGNELNFSSVSNAGNIVLKNFSVITLNISGTNITIENADIGYLTIHDTSTTTLRKVNVSTNGSVYANKFVCDNSSISIRNGGNAVTCTYAEVFNSSVSGMQTQYAYCNNVQFRGNLTIKANENIKSFNDVIVSSCSFYGTSVIYLSCTESSGYIASKVYLVNNIMVGTSRSLVYSTTMLTDKSDIVQNNNQGTSDGKPSSTFNHLSADILSGKRCNFKEVVRMMYTNTEGTDLDTASAGWTEGDTHVLVNNTSSSKTYSNVLVYGRTGTGQDVSTGWKTLTLPPSGCAFLVYSNGSWRVGGPMVRMD